MPVPVPVPVPVPDPDRGRTQSPAPVAIHAPVGYAQKAVGLASRPSVFVYAAAYAYGRARA